MKWLIYLVALLAVWLVPIKGTDVGKLIPVEVLAVSSTGGQVTVRTDTGDMGLGESLEDAFRNLEKTAPGVIYLDTAEYLLLEPEANGTARTLTKYLKKEVRVCSAGEDISLEGIADFLSVHDPGVKLTDVPKSEELPMVSEENGRFEIK